MNEFVLISFFVCVNMCLHVPPPPSSTFTRPSTLVKYLHIDITNIFTSCFLCMCLTMILLSNIELNCRFVSFSTPLNTLKPKSIKTVNQHFLLLFLLYVMLFEYYFIIFLPYEFLNVHLNKIRVKKLNAIVKLVHCGIANITLVVYHRIYLLRYITKVGCYNYPLETIAIWVVLMRISLCPDIHPNPGPPNSNNFAGGFFSFCNWNLNTLSKEDFTRITLLEAHNTEHNYDIISLCETSLDDNVQVPEMRGYKFHSCNHPDGNRSGGVRIFWVLRICDPLRPSTLVCYPQPPTKALQSRFDSCSCKILQYGHGCVR